MGDLTIQQNDFWAKTTKGGRPGMSVLEHSLNVGFVASEIRKHLIRSGFSEEFAHESFVSLIALHDVGKISTGFLVKCEKWVADHGLVERAESFNWKGSESNHAAVSQDFVFEKVKVKGELWSRAVGGHHGRFLKKGTAASLEFDSEMTRSGREELFQMLQKVFGPLPVMKPLHKNHFRFVAGWMTVADWIGSNEFFFPLEQHADEDECRRRAGRALGILGWNRGEMVSGKSFRQLFACDGAEGFDPNLLQETVLNEVKAPGLHIIEAPMGMGKTEAALAAAYQLIQERHHHGIYFALPTQLTSNRIHKRVLGFLKQVVTEPTDVPLAHSSSWLQEDLEIRLRPSLNGEGEAADHAGEGRSWFASSKQALLSRYGVGTIDQALLSVVAAKYFAVRTFGLAGKVVILDEVHSYDAYMSKLIDQLIRNLLELKCSVIVLSATLTKARRACLVEAAGGLMKSDFKGYPMVTTVIDGEAKPEPMESEESGSKTVRIRCEENHNAALIMGVKAAEAGACVLIIRNTVAMAQETYREVSGMREDSDVKVGLLHSRFPQFLRQKKEDEWMVLLGKDGTQRPKGCILVSTQIVEQSVDIDSDLLITDLAPTDLVLQRIGRLWRHQRPVEIRRRTNPETVILTPSIEDASTEVTLKQVLGKSRFVYPPYILLRSLEVWSKSPSIRIPGDIPELIEATYAEREGNEEPEFWNGLKADLVNKEKGIGNKAIVLSAAPENWETLKDEEGVQTRLISMPTCELVLLTREPEDVSPGVVRLSFFSGDVIEANAYEWRREVAVLIHKNAVKVPEYALKEALVAAEAAPDWLVLHHKGRVLYGCLEDDRIAVRGRSENYSLNYTRMEGVSIEKLAGAIPAQQEGDDDYESWF